jgi:hypothetical protein
VFTSVRRRTPAGDYGALLDNVQSAYRDALFSPYESINGILTALRCHCDCADADAFIRDTFEFTSAGWSDTTRASFWISSGRACRFSNGPTRDLKADKDDGASQQGPSDETRSRTASRIVRRVEEKHRRRYEWPCGSNTARDASVPGTVAGLLREDLPRHALCARLRVCLCTSNSRRDAGAAPTCKWNRFGTAARRSCRSHL